MTIVDKQKKGFFKWCNLTFNDKGLGILRTHVKNSSGTQIVHNVYISGEHKIHVGKIELKGANGNLLNHYD
jgi:hypothetical protein